MGGQGWEGAKLTSWWQSGAETEGPYQAEEGTLDRSWDGSGLSGRRDM